jgi:hypothetical protein
VLVPGFVIPAKSGNPASCSPGTNIAWVPACAGMTN